MEEIILLLDYKKSFGSKFNSNPPYSGLDIDEFKKEMKILGYLLTTKYFFEVDFDNPDLYKKKKVLYQSSEANDQFSEYKSHIDDVLYFLQLSGAELIPKYEYFKSHSNKVFMEMIRGLVKSKYNPSNRIYGSYEDFLLDDRKWEFPLVIKMAQGAQSNGVFKANDFAELKAAVKKASKSSYTKRELIKERGRKIKYGENYVPFSTNRNKFIVQPFIPGLSGDYKVLIFKDIFYLIKRENRPNDFRASGGGYNSFIGEFEVPEGLLDYAYKIYRQYKCPYISIDIGINENGFHLIEFQFINFGTSAHSKSKYLIRKKDDKYELEDNTVSIEYLYSYSLDSFFKDAGTPRN